MIKKIFSLLYVLISFNIFSNIVEIESYNLDYYKDAFQTAHFQESFLIEDGISEGDINTSYLKIYDKEEKLLGFIREVYTSPGCESLCKPLDFTLVFYDDGSYLKVLVRSPLTKKAHMKFKEADYDKLHDILLFAPESYETVSNPIDLVDEVTMATKAIFKPDVVKGGALSCFRIHQYKEQTQKHLMSSKTRVVTSILAPSFNLPDLDGKDILFDYTNDGSEYKDKVTVIAFFSTWCKYCKTELPFLQKLFEKYRENENVKFLAIRTWRNNETMNANEFVKKYGLTFRVVSDTPKENPPYSKVAKLYNLEWVPTTIVVDRKGIISNIPQIEDSANYLKEMSDIIENLL